MPARAPACTRCGTRFLEDERAGRVRGRTLVLACAALAGVVLVAAVLRGGPAETKRGEPRVAFRQPIFEQLSARPLSARAAERRLEARFTPLRDDDTAAARCSARKPRPAYSVRYCRIRYPNGTQRTITVLTNARGRELLIER